MSRSLDYFVLDVFTETPLSGNPLAVFPNANGLSTETMQAIAREMNLSETTFIERRAPAIERAEGVRVRIFTTEEELPFAGHPTLGTASLLRAIAPESVAHNETTDLVRLALNVGTIPVRFELHFSPDTLWPARGEMTQRDPEFLAELDRSTVASLIGLEEEDLDPERPVQIVSTGTPFAIVPLWSAASLSRLRVRQDQASTYLRSRGARWFYVLGPEAQLHQDALPVWRARMQFSGGEDPATGSAAGCAISYLVARRAVPSEQQIHLRQGIEINRHSNLFLTATLLPNIADAGPIIRNVHVAGSTVLVAKGELFLP
uniref:Phenazine biosynthesis PhzC/PhzF protein n=1 Tax=mine drainage metagenome TaxID=410659 RepID=E6QL17_9ZZZZ